MVRLVDDMHNNDTTILQTNRNYLLRKLRKQRQKVVSDKMGWESQSYYRITRFWLINTMTPRKSRVFKGNGLSQDVWWYVFTRQIEYIDRG